MDEGQNQDVNQADAQTADSSSTIDQTSSQDQGKANSDAGTQSTEDQKTVPYERFSEVNEKYRSMEQTVQQLQQKIQQFETKSQNTGGQNPEVEAQKAQAKEALRGILTEMGYVSKDELHRMEADRNLETELTRLEKAWDGKQDPELKFNRREVVDFALKNGIGNPEMAFKLMKEKELMNFRIKQAMTNSTGVKSESSNGSGSQNVGTTDDDLKVAVARGDKRAKDILLSRATAKFFKK